VRRGCHDVEGSALIAIPVSNWVVRKRVRQGLRSFRPTMPEDTDSIVQATLTGQQFAAFRALPAFDQAHLVRVVLWLRRHGVTDSDLLTAGLLHDIGKSHNGARVSTIDRSARVVLRRFSPRMMEWLAREPAPGWRKGFALAVHHPSIGAEMAADLGCNERVCWLIANHETSGIESRDPDLALLIRADHES
jgi:putative nucleotidyltransferase with HDIG domain